MSAGGEKPTGESSDGVPEIRCHRESVFVNGREFHLDADLTKWVSGEDEWPTLEDAMKEVLDELPGKEGKGVA